MSLREYLRIIKTSSVRGKIASSSKLRALRSFVTFISLFVFMVSFAVHASSPARLAPSDESISKEIADKKIIAISLVKNEEDVVEAFVRHTLHFVDEMIIAENGSVDGTRDILERLAVDENLAIHVVKDKRFAYDQSGKTTALYRLALRRGADFVMPLDADEFIQATSRDGLRQTLQGIPPAGVGNCVWKNYVLTDSRVLRISERFALRAKRSLHGKVVIKAPPGPHDEDRDAVIAQGNHALVRSGENAANITLENCSIAHFPVRSALQLRRKVIMGWLANVANFGSSNRDMGYHWWELYEKVLAGEHLDERVLAEEAAWYGAKNKNRTGDMELLRDPPLIFPRDAAVRAHAVDSSSSPTSDTKWLDLLSFVCRSWEAKLMEESKHGRVNLPRLPRDCSGTDNPVISFGLNSEKGDTGGFGDRLMGMVTTFYLAVMKNASFAVNWTRPYNLGDYFSVPSCELSRRGGMLDRGDVEAGSENDEGVVSASSSSSSSVSRGHLIVRNDVSKWNYFTDSLFLNDDDGKHVEIHTNSFHWTDVVRNPAFAERAASLGLGSLSQAELFKLAIDELLGKPTKEVRDSFATVLRRLSGGREANDFGRPSYVGIQIRLGGKSGDAVSGFDDLSRHALDQVPCFAAEAVRLCRLMHINSVFVTADSDEAVRAFESAVSSEHAAASAKSSPSSSSSSFSVPPPPIVVQVPGAIAHTDLSTVATEHAKDVWLKSVLDWWVLKHAKALVVSRSGFGETAALASDAETALRLKICQSDASGSSSAVNGSNGSRCEFEEILHQQEGKDIFKSLYATWDQLKGCF